MSLFGCVSRDYAPRVDPSTHLNQKKKDLRPQNGRKTTAQSLSHRRIGPKEKKLNLHLSTSSPSLLQVVMLGLDAAGKTTILYKLHIGEVLSTVPTIGKRDVFLVLFSSVLSLFRHSFLSPLAPFSPLPLSFQASTSKKSSTRTSSSQYGTSAARRSSALYGGTTSQTPTASSTSSTAPTASASRRPAPSFGPSSTTL